ncbi:uncharacterized protein LOC119387586 [Rhipicephalus sanguineus]|uniref:uncharacterized protein LOC119387586 n=1 Tax=Rhipicephalus sanguineus TaxID=34632 RepID=UPI0020C4551C|nr:uncharacterized protein LOC119387586 [Rhipicephalus sanguineus]
MPVGGRGTTAGVATGNIFTMLQFCILVLATVSYVSSTTVTDANAFVDTIINEDVPVLVKESPRLFPYATIEDFSFTVHQNRVTNRDLTVNMTRGKVRGLDTAVQRREDCEALFLRDGQTIVVCDLAIQGLDITFTSLVKGDNLVGIWKTISVNVAVTDGTIQFEAKVPTGHRGGTLRAFSIKDLHLYVTYDSNLSLNEERSQKFKEEVSAKVREELRHILAEYVSLVRRAVNLYTFPRA